MSGQGDLFGPDRPRKRSKRERRQGLRDGRVLRDEGMGRVNEGADPDWKDQALAALRRLCLERPDFIGDELWEFVERPPGDARASGPTMLAGRRAGWMEKTGAYKPSTIPTSHCVPRCVWRSLIYVLRAEKS